MQDDIKEPLIPVTMSFHNIPGKDLKEKQKITMRFVYLLSLICFVIALVLMFFVPVRRSVSCTYNTGKYNCQMRSRSIMRNMGITNFNDITKAVLASKEVSTSTDSRSKRNSTQTMYQMQFLDTNNNKLSYSSSWISAYSVVDKEITVMNKMFSQNKNFDYDFGLNVITILLIIGAFVLPILFIRIFNSLCNDYIYEEINPGQYKAILKGKGIGNFTESEIMVLKREIFGEVKEIKEGSGIIDLKAQALHDKEFPNLEKPELSPEEIANLQDDELTDIQKEFYDRNN